jgi:hypothetical protein
MRFLVAIGRGRKMLQEEKYQDYQISAVLHGGCRNSSNLVEESDANSTFLHYSTQGGAGGYWAERKKGLVRMGDFPEEEDFPEGGLEGTVLLLPKDKKTQIMTLWTHRDGFVYF